MDQTRMNGVNHHIGLAKEVVKMELQIQELRAAHAASDDKIGQLIDVVTGQQSLIDDLASRLTGNTTENDETAQREQSSVTPASHIAGMLHRTLFRWSPAYSENASEMNVPPEVLSFIRSIGEVLLNLKADIGTVVTALFHVESEFEALQGQVDGLEANVLDVEQRESFTREESTATVELSYLMDAKEKLQRQIDTMQHDLNEVKGELVYKRVPDRTVLTAHDARLGFIESALVSTLRLLRKRYQILIVRISNRSSS